MILGFSYFTWFHTLLSIVAIIAGFVVVIGLFSARSLRGWLGLFLSTAILASITGFGFPFTKFLPSHGVGVIALIVLGVTLLARYTFHLAGSWRWIYAVSLVLSLYFLVFVLVAQFFAKIPALRALAPTQSEPPFAIAQLVVLAIFAIITIAAAIKYRPAQLAA